jgi:hypothetical protein
MAISVDIILFSGGKMEFEKDSPFQGSHMLSSQEGILTQKIQKRYPSSGIPRMGSGI